MFQATGAATPFVVEPGPAPLAVERWQLIAEPVHAARPSLPRSSQTPRTQPTRSSSAERLMTAQLDDAHFAAQLVERLKWAGEDAEHAERDATIARAAVGR